MKKVLLFSYAVLFSAMQVFSQTSPDQGITSPIHQKYLNQIVLATQPILLDNINEASFKKKFNVGETIYGRIFLPKGVNTYQVFDTQSGNGDENFFFDGTSIMYFVLKVDDSLVFGTNGVIGTANLPQVDGKFLTTFQVPIFQSEERGGNSQNLVNVLNKLSNGEHKAKIEVWGGMFTVKETKEPLASAEFVLVKGTSSASVGRKFSSLQAGMVNPELEAKMLKATQARAKAEGWSETHTKVKIESKAWTVVRNELTGVILYRMIGAWVYATWPDGHCTYQSFEFKQRHENAAYSTQITCDGIGKQLACDCK